MAKVETKTPWKVAKVIAKQFLESHLFERPILVGSVGRGELLVGDIDVLAENKNRLGERDDTTFNGMQINVWYTDAVHRESMKLFLDGPKSANIARAAKAKAAGLKYNIYGLWKDEARIANDARSIEQMIESQSDAVSETSILEEPIKSTKLAKPSGDYLQIGIIRLENNKDNYKVVSVFELWSGANVIRRYEKVKRDDADLTVAEAVYNGWIEEKKKKGYKLVD